jgi:hypothetical protein
MICAIIVAGESRATGIEVAADTLAPTEAVTIKLFVGARLLGIPTANEYVNAFEATGDGTEDKNPFMETEAWTCAVELKSNEPKGKVTLLTGIEVVVVVIKVVVVA